MVEKEPRNTMLHFKKKRVFCSSPATGSLRGKCSKCFLTYALVSVCPSSPLRHTEKRVREKIKELEN